MRARTQKTNSELGDLFSDQSAVISGVYTEPDPLMEYGLRYHRECEAYDQMVCHHRSQEGIAIPRDSRQLALVNVNASLVRARLANELIAAGLAKPENASSAMHDAIRMSSDVFQREWRRNRRG